MEVFEQLTIYYYSEYVKSMMNRTELPLKHELCTKVVDSWLKRMGINCLPLALKGISLRKIQLEARNCFHLRY